MEAACRRACKAIPAFGDAQRGARSAYGIPVLDVAWTDRVCISSDSARDSYDQGASACVKAECVCFRRHRRANSCYGH
ncbi:hypothetical protein SMMN14_04579 [Sphaerulina musiva]